MSAPYQGDFPVNGAVSFLWATSAIAGESITRATDGTLKIFKSNATAATWATERSSLAGVTQLEDFDSTGMHSVYIDLSDNTDAGFYAAGNEYQVAITGAVVDGKTMNVPLASFSIERANGVLALLKNSTYGLSALETLVDGVESTLGTPAGASVSADVAAIKGDTAAVLADTGTDGVVVAAGSKTGYSLTQTFPINFSALAITAGGIVDADIESINGVTIVGDGSATPFNV